jgi:L-fuculose-phosphate aldolase
VELPLSQFKDTSHNPTQTALRVDEICARQEVLDVALAMSRRNLSPGRSGNVSRRWLAGMLITPSGLAYDSILPDDVVYVAEDGTVEPGQRKPSSEWRFHLAAYAARPDMNAIVHAHSMHATVLACAQKSIPAFHYMVAIAGGKDIPLVPYATFGTKKLARYVAKGLKECDACLLANHGQIALGETCATALELAAEVEVLAEQYYKVLTLGKPHILDDDAMRRVRKRFRSYGQKAQSPK